MLHTVFRILLSAWFCYNNEQVQISLCAMVTVALNENHLSKHSSCSCHTHTQMFLKETGYPWFRVKHSGDKMVSCTMTFSYVMK